MLYTQLNSLIVILLFGTLVMLSFIHFANPLKVNRKGNRWFAFFLLLYASFWLEEIAIFIGVGELNVIVSKMVRTLQIFTPPSLYLSIVFYTHPEFKWHKKQWVHLIIPALYFVLLIEYGIFVWSIVVMLFQSLLYIILSYRKIKQHQHKILIYSSNTQGIELKWLEYIVIQIIILFILILAHNIFISSTDLNLFMNAIQLITGFIIAYFSWQQKEIFPVSRAHKDDLTFVNTEEAEEKEKRKLLQDEELEALKEKLQHLMNDSSPFLDSDLNLLKLAELMNISPHQLSYVINAGFGENFYQFVNRFRVERAKELLLDKEENRTVLAVAFDAGFNSKTVFNTTFKKMTQLTPSEFKKQRS